MRTDDADLVITADSVYELLGTAFRVRSTSAGTGDAVASLFGGFSTPEQPVPSARCFVVVDECGRHGGGMCIHVGGRPVTRPGGLGPVLSWLLAEMNAAAIESYDGFAVHAGAVAAAGQVTAFPGESGRGKTTLVTAALRAGLDYVSDEALCVDPLSRNVIAYPRPLDLSPESLRLTGLADRGVGTPVATGALVAPASIEARVAGPPLVLAGVVRPVRRAGPPVLTMVNRSQAMAWLLEFSFNHYKRPEESFRLAAALARQATAWTLEYDDPLAAGALLRRHADRQ
ncbi:MAG: hypothetical protein ACRD1K_21165 [Acidimicrobiales bacterium]